MSESSFLSEGEVSEDIYELVSCESPRETGTDLLLSSCNIQLITQKSIASQAPQIELIQQIDLSGIVQNHQFMLHDFLNILSQQANRCFQGREIFIYLHQGQIYINLGVHPFSQTVRLDARQFVHPQTQTIKLRAEKLAWSLTHIEMIRNTSELMLEGPPRKISTQQSSEANQRRSTIKNFQKVGYIVKLILRVKQLKRRGRVSQEDLQLKNGRQLTKKSIEDYFYQIRLGFRHGYDFNQNCQQNMKHLRDFVARMEQKLREQQALEQQPFQVLDI